MLHTMIYTYATPHISFSDFRVQNTKLFVENLTNCCVDSIRREIRFILEDDCLPLSTFGRSKFILRTHCEFGGCRLLFYFNFAYGLNPCSILLISYTRSRRVSIFKFIERKNSIVQKLIGV